MLAGDTPSDRYIKHPGQLEMAAHGIGHAISISSNARQLLRQHSDKALVLSVRCFGITEPGKQAVASP
jgi:hypothetical protein